MFTASEAESELVNRIHFLQSNSKRNFERIFKKVD